jgi:hypothetical protein
LKSIFEFCSYSACVRRAAGYCCIQYQVCAGVTNAFSLDGGSSAIGEVDSYCTGDYIAIPGKQNLSNSTKSLAKTFYLYYLKYSSLQFFVDAFLVLDNLSNTSEIFAIQFSISLNNE